MDEYAVVIDVIEETVVVPPPPLHDQTSLEIAANRECDLSAEETMAASQELYEAGLISYPRTSSHSITPDMEQSVSALITDSENASTDSASASPIYRFISQVVPDGLKSNCDALPLSRENREILQKETGWTTEIVERIATVGQAKIYMSANLNEAEIDGRKCLIKKDIDLDYIDPKSGKTNRELMAKGRVPYDSTTGERLELHHIGQEYESPFAELCENSEHGDGKDSILHDKQKNSWRQDKTLKNRYNNSDRPNHWKDRLKKLESEEQ